MAENNNSDKRFTHEKLVNHIKQLLDNGTLEKLFQGADTEKELYTAIGISKSSWLRLKEEIPELQALTIRTRHETFIAIKGAMKKRAMGYSYDEVETEEGQDPKTGNSYTKTRTTKRHVPPDLSAQKLLIANMKKIECKDGKEDKNGELANWTNSTETIEVRSESSVTVAVDDAIKEVLKEITNDK